MISKESGKKMEKDEILQKIKEIMKDVNNEYQKALINQGFHAAELKEAEFNGVERVYNYFKTQ